MKKILILFCFIMVLVGCKDVKLKDGENAIVTFNEGGISAEDLYNKLKDTYGAEAITDMIDKYLLDKIYETTDEETDYVNDSVKSAKDAAKEMGADIDTYVYYYYGVANLDAFKDFISLNYKRSLWIEDYGQETVTDKQINEYYEQNIVGDMEVSHIQIASKATDDMSEEDIEKAEKEAYDKAKEIIKKLDNGEDFSKLAKENSSDEATSSNGGSLGKINDGDALSEIVDEAKKLKVGSYSSTPVKSTYGYHIVYKTTQDEKPQLDETLEATIRATVGKEISEQSSFYVTAMKALREKYEMKFVDTNLQKEYDDLLSQTEASYNNAGN